VWWLSLTDVSGQPTGPICKGQWRWDRWAAPKYL
jgi:hypothetical protein